MCLQYQLRQENFEFRAILGYIGRPNLPPKIKIKKIRSNGRVGGNGEREEKGGKRKGKKDWRGDSGYEYLEYKNEDLIQIHCTHVKSQAWL